MGNLVSSFSLAVLSLCFFAGLGQAMEESEVYFKNTWDSSLPMRPGPGVGTGDRLSIQIRSGQVIRVLQTGRDEGDNQWFRIEAPPGVTCPANGCWIARTWNGTDRFEQVATPGPDEIINPFQDYVDYGRGTQHCDISRVANLTGLSGVSMKSRAELRDWMKCFTSPLTSEEQSKGIDGSRGYDLYVQLENQLQAAADVTGLPYAFLACKFWRESRWDDDAVSGSDAFGFGQFKLETMMTMEGINSLEGSRMDVEEKLAKMIRNAPRPGEKGWKRFRDDVPFLRNRSRNLARRDIMRAEWQDYVSRIKSNPGPYSVYPTRMDTDMYCSGETQRYYFHGGKAYIQAGGQWVRVSDRTTPMDSDVAIDNSRIRSSRCDNWEHNNPLWSMGASAMYLKDLALTLDQKYTYTPVPIAEIADRGNYVERTPQNIDDVIFQVGGASPMDFLLLVSAAYNAGPAGFVEDMMNAGRNLEDWLGYMGDNPRYAETRDHMKSIKDCMSPGVFRLSTGENPQRRCER